MLNVHTVVSNVTSVHWIEKAVQAVRRNMLIITWAVEEIQCIRVKNKSTISNESVEMIATFSTQSQEAQSYDVNIDSQIKTYVDTQFETQREWNAQVMNTISQHFVQLEQTNLQSEINNEIQNNNITQSTVENHNQDSPEIRREPGILQATTHNPSKNLKYTSRFKLSRAITSYSRPYLQSVEQTIKAIPPRCNILSTEELKIMTQLNPKYFNITTPINKYLKNGLKHGFRFNFAGKRIITVQENLKSVNIEPAALTKYIEDELSVGHMCGPFTLENPLCSAFQINPCGLVEKKDTNLRVYRVISHLSAPTGTSINDGINVTEFATKYENINHAVNWIIQYWKGCLLSKIDIKDAYCILPVHPVDQVLQGLRHNNKIYFDKALAFGNRASGGIFCRFANAITRVAVQQGIKSIKHYVDDFLIISDTTAKQELQQFLRILEIMNILYKPSKLEGPYTALTFLELQLLVGSLMWLYQTIPQGRPFIQQFIKALKWSGVYFLEDRIWLQPETKNLFTDASNLGGGATYEVYFIAFNWSMPIDQTTNTIQMRELLTSLIAILTFAPLWNQKRLIMWTDNQANAEAFYASFCKNTAINDIIAHMYRAQIRGNFFIKLEYIPGKNNIEADLLLHNSHREYMRQNPLARYLKPAISRSNRHMVATRPQSQSTEPPLNIQAATILGVQPTGYKTYNSIIKHYQKLAKENE
ncbi:9922_t:CDS:2 [Ambispora leptoticha]|uniref:9922_t:CDS:1 n=1 Tax=Ambispora leptoticha TaxID=144679 RepID=A0A9N9GF42_9GLOM|nr:9922_t:CDS:2 [Ambispora leptoticha]